MARIACRAGGSNCKITLNSETMKRSLLKQMKNEWRDNVWLIIELTVVCLAIWVISVVLYFNMQGLFTPRGFDPENVYSLTTNIVPKESADYVELEDSAYYADFKVLLDRLRKNPNVESVAIHWNGLPYYYNYNGNVIDVFEGNDSVSYYGNVRTVSPDYVKVLGIKSETGATQEQLIEMLNKGEILISGTNESYTQQGRDPYALKGKKIIIGKDSTKVMRVGDIIEQVRRNDYELSFGGTILLPMQESELWGNIALKVKPDKGGKFEEDFRNDASLRKLRNVYLSDLKNLMDIKEGNQRSIEVNIRLFEAIALFLMMTIFLGLLGTFWFRMQQRAGEIAIRKVAGAGKKQVFRRIISEGLILLCCSLAIASAIMWPFILTDNDLIKMDLEWEVVLIAEVATGLLVALGIILSLWWPARRAMAIEPAVAIKDE